MHFWTLSPAVVGNSVSHASPDALLTLFFLAVVVDSASPDVLLTLSISRDSFFLHVLSSSCILFLTSLLPSPSSFFLDTIYFCGRVAFLTHLVSICYGRSVSYLHASQTPCVFVLQAFLAADSKLMGIARQRKKLILKTRPYFECKANHDKILMGTIRRKGTRQTLVPVLDRRTKRRRQATRQRTTDIDTD